ERLVERDPRVADEAVAPRPAFGEDRGRRGHDEARDVKYPGGDLPHHEDAEQGAHRDEGVAEHPPARHTRSFRRAKIRARTSSLAVLNRGSNSMSMVRGRGRSIGSTRAMRPGRGVKTTTRSASRIASGMLCVTKRIVL